MSTPPDLQPSELEHLRALGISTTEVVRQLRLLRHPPAPPALDRPCRIGDGIKQIGTADADRLIRLGEGAAHAGRIQKFVPASGAATRMFSGLEEFTRPAAAKSVRELQLLADQGNSNTAALLQFLAELERFPFYPTLRASVEQSGERITELREDCGYVELLDHLLEPAKLAYSSKAKGLLDFHRYPAGHARTAFEEQLIESLGYCTDSQGNVNSHFTVAPDQLEAFEALSSEVCRTIRESHGVLPVVTFSTQSRAGDTLAIDSDGEPLRTPDGDLLLRPAGHGALIQNLQNLDGDIVVIKNIDNIAPEARHAGGAHWKKLLVGHLLEVQAKIFSHLGHLRKIEDSIAAGGALDAIEPAIAFLQEELALALPSEVIGGDPAAQREYLISRLDRPLRVCGMVQNEGEPGGGPFWVGTQGGEISGQIIEAAQIDRHDPSAVEIWASATHFNPVDLVCSLRDAEGQAYDLQQFIDPTTAMVVNKEADGRKFRALERPGLWNGAMAGWNTAFVEVPAETFTPVKTIFDLLRPEHQPH
ncbi:MAG: DUF4301 family protein [Thermoanaerobaculia bacterium]